MRYLNQKGAERLQQMKFSNITAGLALIEAGDKGLFQREGASYRKFKAVNHKQVMYLDLEMDEYSYVHPADIEPFYLDNITPLVFETIPFAPRGVYYKVVFCCEERRCYFKIQMANGAKAEDHSYAINFRLREEMDNAIQNLRICYIAIPQIGDSKF